MALLLFYAGSGFAAFAIILNKNKYYSVKNFLKNLLTRQSPAIII